jgi:hypothetical protein
MLLSLLIVSVAIGLVGQRHMEFMAEDEFWRNVAL